MANAGGAWDNAKKYVEKGNLGGKGLIRTLPSLLATRWATPLKTPQAPL